MVRMIRRRSSSLRASSRCTIPAPRSNPSSTTYATTMIATRQNQIVSIMLSSGVAHGCAGFHIGGAFGFRSDFDDAPHQEEEHDAEHHVEPHESEQREHRVAGVHILGVSIGGAHQSVYEPRLTTDLRS